MTANKTLCNLLKSVKLNYKSWLILLFVLYNIVRIGNKLKNQETTQSTTTINSIITIVSIFFLLYIFHYISHFSLFPILSVSHNYHHNNDNFLSHFCQIMTEFISIMFFVFIKYLSSVFAFASPFQVITETINTNIILFFYIFYTLVHNFNYSFLKVNQVHQYHHKDQSKNLGTDILDILFGTKHDIDNSLENTDHYIPVMLVSFVFVLVLQRAIPESTIEIKRSFIWMYLIVFVIYIFLSVFIYFYLQVSVKSKKGTTKKEQ